MLPSIFSLLPCQSCGADSQSAASGLLSTSLLGAAVPSGARPQLSARGAEPCSAAEPQLGPPSPRPRTTSSFGPWTTDPGRNLRTTNHRPLTTLFLALILSAALLGQTVSAPAPASAGANLPAQRIGINDLVSLYVYDAPEFTRTARVGTDGCIRLPMVQQRIKAAGLLPIELETEVAKALQDEGVLVNPFVTVTMAEYASHPISVAGSVKNPTTFQADNPVSLLEALTRAGGLAPEAGNEILVPRTQEGPDGTPISLTQRIIVKALIDGADPSVNLLLRGGEEIRVPEVGKVFVVGNVKLPGAYPVEDGNDTTVLKALAHAQGLLPYTTKQAFILRREGNGNKNEIAIELRKIMQRQAPDVPLVANDVLYIPDSSGRRSAAEVLARIAGFGATTASGVIIWGSR